MALLMYLEDNDNKTADLSYDPSTGLNKANGFNWYDSSGAIREIDDKYAYWGVAYIDYVKDNKVFGCPSYRNVAELIYPGEDPKLIHEAAFGLNEYISNRKTTSIPQHAEVIVCHDHVEPRMEQDEVDMFHNNDEAGAMNLTDYRQAGKREEHYRGIFRHNIRIGEPFRTGGRANILWLDGHVSALEETTGDNVLKNWYTAGLNVDE